MARGHILLVLVAILFAVAELALGSGHWEGESRDVGSVLELTEDLTINANSLEMFVYNDGNFAYDHIGVFGKTDGLYFPRSTKKTVVYAAGLWLAATVKSRFILDTALVDGDTLIDSLPALRIAQAEYESEFIPGNMENGTYDPDWQDQRYRVYKIRRDDYAGNSVDYAQWPEEDGAPVGQSGDPALLGDQMLWSVYNDADITMHQNESGGTPPLGVEVQHTLFAFARPGTLASVIFMKFRVVNKGADSLDEMFASIWVDPDIGNADDDLAGCDTTLSLGYCYNYGSDEIYGSNPPAVGVDLLQGPIVPGDDTDTAFVSGEVRPGYRNLPMCSFIGYQNGEDPQSAGQTYDLMRGLHKNPTTKLMEPVVDPLTDDTTTFVYPGDPVAGTGWFDWDPDDKRMMVTAGPFAMNPGDTQEIACAVMVGQGSSPLNSITVLREIDLVAQTTFDENFDSTVLAVHEDESALPPTRLVLYQNHPNPFNNSTLISFYLPRAGEPTIEIFNILGQRIRALRSGDMTVGPHSVLWDGTDQRGHDVPSGVYLYRVRSDGFSVTRKMMLLK